MCSPDPSLGLTAFTSISQHGSTLAAGAGRFVSLWDLRTASRVHSLDLGDGLQVPPLLNAFTRLRCLSEYA